MSAHKYAAPQKSMVTGPRASGFTKAELGMSRPAGALSEKPVAITPGIEGALKQAGSYLAQVRESEEKMATEKPKEEVTPGEVAGAGALGGGALGAGAGVYSMHKLLNNPEALFNIAKTQVEMGNVQEAQNFVKHVTTPSTRKAMLALSAAKPGLMGALLGGVAGYGAGKVYSQRKMHPFYPSEKKASADKALRGMKVSKLHAEVKKSQHCCKTAHLPVEPMLNELIKINGVSTKHAEAIRNVRLPANLSPEQVVFSGPTPAPPLPQAGPTVSREEAEQALGRLQNLESTKPTAGELARGAAVGAAITPLATLAGRVVSGDKLLGDLAEKTEGIKNPKLRTLGKGVAALRNLGSSAASGAFFGGAIPAVRGEVEREAERKKLRNYLGQPQPDGLARRVVDSAKESLT